MIPKENHLSGSHASICPYTGVTKWHIVHWDQRRTITVTFVIDPKLLLEPSCDTEETARAHLNRHIDNLGPDVHAITVSEDGELVTVSSDPNDDETLCPPVPALQDLQDFASQVKTVRRAELRELDRIWFSADLVSFRRRKAVFKYALWSQRSQNLWNELNILLRLQPHPNIVPLDQVVIEKLRGQEYIIGFTTRYIAGGCLDATETGGDRRVFKLKWLKQLIRVVDDLNYKYGIYHQDITPRNLLVNEATDQITLIDFGCSARFGAVDDTSQDQYRGDRYGGAFKDVDDVILTMYAIITRDKEPFLMANQGQAPCSLLNMEDWVKHPDVRLDKPVARYRTVLDTWVLKRKARGNLKSFTDAPNYINWPRMPEGYHKAEDTAGASKQDEGLVEDSMDTSSSGEAGGQVPGQSREAAKLVFEDYPRSSIEKKQARAKGLEVINWQRPGQEKIKEGMHVYADGTVIMSNKTY